MNKKDNKRNEKKLIPIVRAFLKNHKKTYLYSCGKLRNGKKIGTWVYFDENGKIKKQKAH
jgi:hypothetical protein